MYALSEMHNTKIVIVLCISGHMDASKYKQLLRTVNHICFHNFYNNVRTPCKSIIELLTADTRLSLDAVLILGHRRDDFFVQY